MLSSSFGIIGRGEYRDALVWLGTERAYLTKGWRATGGVRWVMSTRAVLKAEYLHNGEYGGIPQIHGRRVHQQLGAEPLRGAGRRTRHERK